MKSDLWTSEPNPTLLASQVGAQKGVIKYTVSYITRVFVIYKFRSRPRFCGRHLDSDSDREEVEGCFSEKPFGSKQIWRLVYSYKLRRDT